MKTYEVTIWGKDWMKTHHLITEYQVSDSVIVLRSKKEGLPYFETGYSIHAITGWAAKEEIRHS